MYCKKCGNQLDDGQAFCDKCGTASGEIGGGPPYQMRLEEKSAGIAVVLSVLITGLGQMYVGKILRGVLVLLGSIGLGMFGVLIILGAATAVNFNGFVGGMIIYAAIAISYWAWNIYDAYKLANQYNDYVMKNGKRPW